MKYPKRGSYKESKSIAHKKRLFSQVKSDILDINQHMVLQATAGVCIIQIIKEKNGALVWTSEQKGKIVRGKVIDVGETGFSDFGAKIPAPCKKGDVVWFLKYEQGYDDAYIDGENYVLALFKDVRVVEK